MRKTLVFALSLVKPPLFNDDEKNRVASFLNIIILSIIVVTVFIAITDALAGVWITGINIFIGLIPLLIAYWFMRQKRLTEATYITLVALILTVTVLLSVGQGIHDIGLLFYGLILIIASFLVDLKGLISVTALLIISVGIVVFGQMFQILPMRLEKEFFDARPADFIIVSLSIMLGAIGTGVISNTVLRAIKRSKESEARWKSLVDNAPDLILGITPDGKISFINNSVAKLPIHVEIGDDCFLFVPENLRQRARMVISRVIQGQSVTREIPLQFSGGIERWYSLRIGPVYDETLRIYGAMIIATDIQYMKDIEAELRNNQEALQHRAEQMATLYDISKTVTSLQDLESALQLILTQIDAVIPLDTFIVAFYNKAAHTLSFPLVYDADRLWSEADQRILPGGIAADVLITRISRIVNRNADDVNLADTFLPVGDSERTPFSGMVVPLLAGNEPIGIIEVRSYSQDTYNKDYLSLLSGAANQVAIAVENSRLYDQLQKELSERRRAEEAVRNLNTVLEERVLARTRELEEANKELSAFTYTISHDLRAPLRGIAGFSQIFYETYANFLPAEGMQYIRRIQTNAKYMGQLVDDLLTFTHLGRQPARLAVVNMDELVHDKVSKLAISNPAVKFEINPLPAAISDHDLISIVWTNLLSNALKFTQNEAVPCIEIGGNETDAYVNYFIKDNGVGFNMEHAKKLFGVFQRLHHQDEFEGTGVGLAIVHRILQKHGGQVWAVAAPKKGATFYFSLPKDRG